MTGIRAGTKGTGYWDQDRDKKGLGTGQRCGGTGTVTWGRTKTETKNIPYWDQNRDIGVSGLRTGTWWYQDQTKT